MKITGLSTSCEHDIRISPLIALFSHSRLFHCDFQTSVLEGTEWLQPVNGRETKQVILDIRYSFVLPRSISGNVYEL